MLRSSTALVHRTLFVLCVLLALGCEVAEPVPRALTTEELAEIEIDAGFSKWLPIRFSGTVHNHSSITVHEIELEFGGVSRSRPLRLDPGESRRFSLQWVFPEDDAWERAEEGASWRLVAATGLEADS